MNLWGHQNLVKIAYSKEMDGILKAMDGIGVVIFQAPVIHGLKFQRVHKSPSSSSPILSKYDS